MYVVILAFRYHSGRELEKLLQIEFVNQEDKCKVWITLMPPREIFFGEIFHYRIDFCIDMCLVVKR